MTNGACDGKGQDDNMTSQLATKEPAGMTSRMRMTMTMATTTIQNNDDTTTTGGGGGGGC